jgi:hypothetical protein
MKHIESVGDSMQHLFDMKDDVLETVDLAADASGAAKAGDHARLLRKWEARMEQTVDAALDSEVLAVLPC